MDAAVARAGGAEFVCIWLIGAVNFQAQFAWTIYPPRFLLLNWTKVIVAEKFPVLDVARLRGVRVTVESPVERLVL